MKKTLSNIKFKQFLLLVAIIYATENTYAQEERKNYIGVNYSFGRNDYNRNGITFGGFGASHKYEGNDFKSITIEYARRTTSNTEFCTGLTAIFAYLATTSTYNSISGGGSNTSNYRDKIFIFSLPLHLKYHFLKYLFVEGGLDLNYHPSKGYEYGAGLSVNMGVEYVFHSGITLSASPFGRYNLLIGRDKEHDMGSAGTYSMLGPDTLFQWGIEWGIGYRF
ncbi:MAG: hypothetical protein LBG15_08025 [Dysgonamonadaceae bacterium]|jgi:hypothetical protein|nr:hypothetical protein [Dysgonamonadaceae bacterium]